MKNQIGLRRGSERRTANAQAKVMRGYKDRRAVRNEGDVQKLHMFFSPTRVPKGLTNEEVRICIALYPLREAERQRQEQSDKSVDLNKIIEGDIVEVPDSIMKPLLLPKALYSTKQMTRGRFDQGIEEFVCRIAKHFAKV